MSHFNDSCQKGQQAAINARSQMLDISADSVAGAGRRSQVMEQADETALLANQLCSLLKRLEEKISGVLMPQPLTPTCTDDQQPSEHLVPVANRMRDTNLNLRGLVYGLEQMLPRIEV